MKTGLFFDFRRKERGAIAVMFALLLLVLLGCVAFATNIYILINARSALQNALDAAIIATTREYVIKSLDDDAAEEYIKEYIKSSSEPRFFEAANIKIFDFDIDEELNNISANAAADVNFVFPLFFNNANFSRVAVDAVAEYSAKEIEIAIMLDTTYSMTYMSKLADLQAAAKAAVALLLDGQDPSNPRIRVSLIPYNLAVNLGPLAADMVHIERYTQTLEPPGYYDLGRTHYPAPDQCATERKGTHQFTDVGPEVALVNRDYRLKTPACPADHIVPLSADISLLNNSIDNLRARGQTAGHIGIQWSWYMISPEWAAFLPSSSVPAEYEPRKVKKVVILMTDGDFNHHYIGNMLPHDRSRDFAKTLCTEMKKKDIEIFAIGFSLPSGTYQAQKMLSECASPDDPIKHFYKASNGAELLAAYIKIVADIKRLVLAK